MDRLGFFTIEDKEGVSYDASHIFCVRKSLTGWFIYFICSGCLEEVPIEDVKEIRFSPGSVIGFCDERDRPYQKWGEQH